MATTDTFRRGAREATVTPRYANRRGWLIVVTHRGWLRTTTREMIRPTKAEALKLARSFVNGRA